MADSLRQRIIDAIVTRMLLINGSGSYTRNVGTNVEDSRTNWAEDDLEDYDAISVFDGDALANPSSPTAGYQAVIWSMPVLIRAFAKQGSSGPANVRNLIKDINTAIKVDDTWSGIAMQTRQIKEAVVRNPDSFEIEAAEVEIEVQYKTSKFNSES